MKNSNGGICSPWFIAGCIVGFVGTTNVYFTKDGVLKELRGTCPGVKQIVKVERNWFAPSIITAETYGGGLAKYELQTNAFFMYRLKVK